MTSHKSSTSTGPFAKAKKDANEFAHNLFLSHTLNQCATNLLKIQKKYDEALLRGDPELIEGARLELQVYQSSITLTACMFEEIDDIST
jgi:hypothetical protein